MAKVKVSNNDETSINLKYAQGEDWYDVIINDELQLHITRGDTGYIIDCYKHINQEVDEDNHDFDEDFITSCTVWDEDLVGDEN